MTFHLPPNCSWQPAVISRELSERGLFASVSDNDVLISWPSKKQSIAVRFLNRFLHRHPPVLRIQYNPHRFLINVHIFWDTLRHQDLFDQCYDAIYQVMVTHGYLEATTDYTESGLATHYCGANHYVIQKLDKIAELHREMEKLVMHREYELAARTRETVQTLYKEIDAILFEACVGR